MLNLIEKKSEPAAVLAGLAAQVTTKDEWDALMAAVKTAMRSRYKELCRAEAARWAPKQQVCWVGGRDKRVREGRVMGPSGTKVEVVVETEASLERVRVDPFALRAAAKGPAGA